MNNVVRSPTVQHILHGCHLCEAVTLQITSSHAIAIVAHVTAFKPSGPVIALDPDSSEDQLLPESSWSGYYLIPTPAIHTSISQHYRSESVCHVIRKFIVKEL